MAFAVEKIPEMRNPNRYFRSGRKKMNLSPFSLKVQCLLCVPLIFFTCFSVHASDFLSISKIDQTITTLDESKFLPLTIIQKTWSESFDGNSKIELHFFAIFDEPASEKNYWQSIPVYDNGKELEVSEWSSADCSLEQASIQLYSDGEVYLLLSNRSASTSQEITPQYEPEKLRIRIFKLMLNANSEPGLPRAYFSKIREQTSTESVCTSTEVDSVLSKIRQ